MDKSNYITIEEKEEEIWEGFRRVFIAIYISIPKYKGYLKYREKGKLIYLKENHSICS